MNVSLLIVFACFVCMVGLNIWQTFRLKKLNNKVASIYNERYHRVVTNKEETIGSLNKGVSMCADELNLLSNDISKYEKKLGELNDELDEIKEVRIIPPQAIDVGSLIVVNGVRFEVTDVSHDKSEEDCDEVAIFAEHRMLDVTI